MKLEMLYEIEFLQYPGRLSRHEFWVSDVANSIFDTSMQLPWLLLLSIASVAFSSPVNDTFLWGSYRPNLYFGIRPRIPQSLLTGLMWFGTQDYASISRKHRVRSSQLLAYICGTQKLVTPAIKVINFSPTPGQNMILGKEVYKSLRTLGTMSSLRPNSWRFLVETMEATGLQGLKANLWIHVCNLNHMPVSNVETRYSTTLKDFHNLLSWNGRSRWNRHGYRRGRQCTQPIASKSISTLIHTSAGLAGWHQVYWVLTGTGRL